MTDTKKYPTNLVIDLENALNRSADNFTCLLFCLILKADNHNKERIRQGFPLEMEVHDVWYQQGDQFFKDQRGMKDGN